MPHAVQVVDPTLKANKKNQNLHLRTKQISQCSQTKLLFAKVDSAAGHHTRTSPKSEKNKKSASKYGYSGSRRGGRPQTGSVPGKATASQVSRKQGNSLIFERGSHRAGKGSKFQGNMSLLADPSLTLVKSFQYN